METLPRLFLSLASCITTVTGDPDKFNDLLSALFKYDWSGGSLSRAAFVNLLAHLVSAKSTFLHPTLQMLARSLAAPGPVLPKTQEQLQRQQEPQGEENDENNDDTDAARKASVHEALRTVLTLVPAGVPELYPALADAFPHRRIEGSGSVVNYARQLLRVSEYTSTLGVSNSSSSCCSSNGGSGGGLVLKRSSSSKGSSSSRTGGTGGSVGGAPLRDRVLGLIIERCLEIDVEIKIEDSGEARVEEKKAVAESEPTAAIAVHLAHDPSAALVLSEHVYVEDPNFIVYSHHHAAALAAAAAPVKAQEDPRDKGEEGEDEVDEMAEKLDCVMLLLFEHLDRVVGREGGEEGRAHAAQLFEGLAPTLEGPILATHRCKYVQFVLFYLAARDPAGRVPSLLVDRLLVRALREENAPVGARQAALAYLSSFLVRSRALSVGGIVRALTVMVEAAETYLARSASDLNIMMLLAKHEEEEEGEEEYGWGAVKKEEGGCGLAGEEEEEDGEEEGTGRHVLFYSICQAVFYVVGFHHSTLDGEDILGVGLGSESAAAAVASVECKDGMPLGSFSSSSLAQQLGLKMRLGRLACSPLRPLDHCLESVKREFLRLAHLHAFVPAGALVGLGWGGGGEEEVQATRRNNHNPLDSYFPFDPYLLRRSSRFVATPDVYRYWQQQQQQQQQQLQRLSTVKKEEGEGEGEEQWEGRSVTSEDGHSSGSGVCGSEDVDEDEDEDDSSSSSSNSSISSRGSDEEVENDDQERGEEEEDMEAEEEDMEAEEEDMEAEEEDDVMSMSVASTGNGLVLAKTAAYWREQQTYAYTDENQRDRRRKARKKEKTKTKEKKEKDSQGGKGGGKNGLHSRKRERVDSMDYDQDGFGEEEGEEEEEGEVDGEDGTDDEEGERAPAAAPAAMARTGLLLSDHVVEAAAVAAAAQARVRKESVSSVGSW